MIPGMSFPGPLDAHPLLKKEGGSAAPHAAQTASRNVAKAASGKVAAPAPAKLAPYGVAAPGRPSLAAPSTHAVKAPTSPEFSPKLQSTFGTLSKRGVGAPSKLASPKIQKEVAQKERGHSLFSLHTLGNIGKTLVGADLKAAGVGTTIEAQNNPELKAIMDAESAHAGVPGEKINSHPFANSERFAKGVLTGVEHIPGSAVQTAISIIPGTIKTGAAVVEAAKGNEKPIEQIGGGILHMAEHPLATWEKEPVPLALMAGGAEGTVGSAAGAAARSGLLGERAADLADVARPDLKLYNDEAVPREYSKNVIHKGMQVAADKFRDKVLKQDPNQATGARLNRHIYGGGAIGQRLPFVQGFFKPGLVDKAEGAVKGVRKLETNAAKAMMHTIQGKVEATPDDIGKAGVLTKGTKNGVAIGTREAVPLAVEGTIRTADTAVEDLNKRLGDLQVEEKALTGKELKLNQAQQGQIKTLLDDKDFSADTPKAVANRQAVIDAAREFAEHQGPLSENKVQIGAMHPDQLHAKYVPYALHHMGAEYNLDPGTHPLVDEIGSLTDRMEKARGDIKTAQDRVENASAPHPRVSNTHEVAQTRQALKDAELAKSRIRGQLGSKETSVLHHYDLNKAKAAYADAKARNLTDHQVKLQDAKYAYQDLKNHVYDAKDKLGYLKKTGAIKNNGHYWPRLEKLDTDYEPRTYSGEHTAPRIGEGTPLSEMSPEEKAVYGVGKDGKVNIYRVVPEHLTSEEAAPQTGDWVSTSKDVSEKQARISGGRVYQAKVDANQLVRRMGDDENEFGFVAKNPLDHELIVSHAKGAIGDREIGFLTHKEETYGTATHSQTGVRPAIESKARTGEAYKTGAYDSSWRALDIQAKKDAEDIAGHLGRNSMLRRFGIGRYASEEDARTAADNFNHSPDGKQITDALGEVVPVHIGPNAVSKALNNGFDQFGATDTMKDFKIAEHKTMDELSPEGKFTLLPKSVADRIAEHDKLNSATATTKAFQAVTNKWRGVALYTNPRWPVGIAQENAIRLAFAGVNPFALFKVGTAFKLGNKLADHFEKIAADGSRTEAERFAAKAQVSAIDAGTQYGGLVNNAVERRLQDAGPDGVKKLGVLFETMSNHAPTKQFLWSWDKWTQGIGSALHKMEVNAKKAHLGKVALDETTKFSKEWQALNSRQEAATKAWAERKLTASQSAKLGDDILKAAGNWSHLTPAVRKMTQTYAPFDLWWLNSMKFITQTLPVDHPFKSAALAALGSATGANQVHPKAEYLNGSLGIKLPVVGNVNLEVSKYSPFGIGVGEAGSSPGPVGGLEETARGIFGAPQIAGPVETILGRNTLTHEPLVSKYAKPIGFGTLAGKAFENLIEEYIPGLRPAESIAKGGGKAEPRSLNPIATKKGTNRGPGVGLFKTLFPVPFVMGKTTPTLPRGSENERTLREPRERPVRETPVREPRYREPRER